MGRGCDPVTASAQLRALPAVHELAAQLEGSHSLAVAAARRAVEEARAALLGGEPAVDVLARSRELLAELDEPSLRRVINATGVIVHTNLGRAPLAASAQAAVARVAEGYANLELDLGGGSRGSRNTHVGSLLCELTGAQDAFVVNNGAGAVLLAAAALGAKGLGIVVSRGQLVEIGGGFRIPEVIAQSGARLVEVGTTNRTRLSDYERALDATVAAVLRVHPSNFRSLGFVQEVSIEALCRLGVPVIDDVGSGVIGGAVGIPAIGEEPSVRRSVAAGAALVCCSGDKLLGGPQAGLIVGRSEFVKAARVHPLARALRIDKLSLAALAATLRLYLDPARARREIPVLAMLDVSEEVLQRRAQMLAEAIGADACPSVSRASGKVGGGALPLLELEGPVVVLSAGDPAALSAGLRAGEPPVVGRIHEGKLVLDPRTLADEELPVVAEAVRAVSRSVG